MRKLPIITIVEPIASLRSGSSDGHGDVPNQLIGVLLPPMWKFTGISRSAHTSHSGSQCRLARSGKPSLCGSALVLTPRKPETVRTLDLAHRAVDVPPRQDRHREQALTRPFLDLGHGVVEDRGAQHPELRIDRRR